MPSENTQEITAKRSHNSNQRYKEKAPFCHSIFLRNLQRLSNFQRFCIDIFNFITPVQVSIYSFDKYLCLSFTNNWFLRLKKFSGSFTLKRFYSRFHIWHSQMDIFLQIFYFVSIIEIMINRLAL